MADSIRKQLLDAIKAALEVITVANGFDTDIQRVFRVGESTVNIDEYPSLIMMDRGDVSTRIRLQFAYENRLQMEIKAFTRDGDDDDRYDEIMQIQKDVRKKIEEDETFGGLAAKTRIFSTAPDFNEPKEPQVTTLVTIEVAYRTRQNDPETKVDLFS